MKGQKLSDDILRDKNKFSGNSIGLVEAVAQNYPFKH